jgi:hypothetical protein
MAFRDLQPEMTVLCPCCRRPLDVGETVDVTHLRDVKMANQHKVLINALVDVYPRSVKMGFLVDRLYADDPDGGPDDPVRLVRSLMTRIRKELPEYGWSVPANSAGRGNYGSYRLEPLKDPAQ